MTAHVVNTEVAAAPLAHLSLKSRDLYSPRQLNGPDTRRVVRFSHQLSNTSCPVTRLNMPSLHEEVKTLIDKNDGLINSRSERSVRRQKTERCGYRTQSLKSSFSTSKQKRRDYLRQLQYLSDGTSRDSSPDL